MKRIVLFLFTNLAVILILSIVLNIMGVDRILDAQGLGLDMANMLVFVVVFGFGGFFTSLAMSKWTAKRITGARVISTPRDLGEAWLVNTVKRQAERSGISTKITPGGQTQCFSNLSKLWFENPGLRSYGSMIYVTLSRPGWFRTGLIFILFRSLDDGRTHPWS